MNQHSSRARCPLLMPLSLIAVSAFPGLCLASPFAFDAFAEIGSVVDNENNTTSPGGGIAIRHSSGFGVELSKQRLGSYEASSFAFVPPLRNPVAVSLASPHGDSTALMVGYRHVFSDGHWFGGVRAGAHRWRHNIDVATTFGGFIVDNNTKTGTDFAAGAEIGRSFSNKLSVSLNAQNFVSLGPDQQRVAVRLSYTF